MDPLARCQNDLYYRLLSRLQLKAAGVMILEMRPRTEADGTMIISNINNVLAGQVSDGSRTGLAILLPLPAFEPKSPNLPALMGTVIVKVIVLENIMINLGEGGTGLSCEAAAILVGLAGHAFVLADNRRAVCDSITPLKVDEEDFQADIAYEVTFKIADGFAQEACCQQPAITIDGDELTVTSATSGSVVYLTLDGSLPCAENPAATPVATATPIAAPITGTIIRAVATRPDLNPSVPAYLVAP